MKKVINVISIVLTVFLIMVVVFLFMMRIMGQTPSIFGYYVFRVSSDSMEPTFMVGDVILVHSADVDDIHLDDIITYKSNDGSMKGREVTHRVVDGPYVKDGVTYFQTKGDAAGAPLDKVITYDQVEGKYLSKLSLVTKLFSFVSTPTGVFAFIGIIVVLFTFEIISMLISYRKINKLEDELENENPDDL